MGRHVVDDQVGHHLKPIGEFADRSSPSDAPVDLVVIAGIESGIRVVDRHEEGEKAVEPLADFAGETASRVLKNL